MIPVLSFVLFALVNNEGSTHITALITETRNDNCKIGWFCETEKLPRQKLCYGSQVSDRGVKFQPAIFYNLGPTTLAIVQSIFAFPCGLFVWKWTDPSHSQGSTHCPCKQTRNKVPEITHSNTCHTILKKYDY